MNLSDLTNDDLSFIRKRCKRAAWRTPWFADELIGRVCLDLVRRPDLISNHPLSQAVNMLIPSRLTDLLKQREQLPGGISAGDWDHRLPTSELTTDDLEWRELHARLVDMVGERPANVAITLTQLSSGQGRNSDHRDVAKVLGISRQAVSRDVRKVRAALSASQ